MNREIKFRAWDKQNKIMRSLETAFLGKNGYYIVDDMPGFEKMLPSAHLRDFELMQYTGLKDKNGVEIYEGDIIALDMMVDDPRIMPVCWGKYGWFNALGWFLDDTRRENGNYGLSHNAPKNVRVIGNIYENPELLESKS